MGSSMSLKLITPCEPLPTKEPVADKGSLASVQTDMGPKQGCLPESLSAVWDVAYVLLLALLPRPEGVGLTVGRKREWGGERTKRNIGVRSESSGELGGKSWALTPVHRATVEQGVCQAVGLAPVVCYLFSPSLQLGHVQAMRRLFSPGWASPARACSICSWIWVGLSPLMVKLFPETFCTVSCCCPMEERRTWFRKGSSGQTFFLHLLHRLRMSHGS